jgi:hypothetical protein
LGNVTVTHEAGVVVDLALSDKVAREDTAGACAVLAGTVTQAAVQAKVTCWRIILLRALERLLLDIRQ